MITFQVRWWLWRAHLRPPPLPSPTPPAPDCSPAWKSNRPSTEVLWEFSLCAFQASCSLTVSCQQQQSRKKREGFLFPGLGMKHKFPLSVRLNGSIFHTWDDLLLAITSLISMWLSSGHCFPPKSIPWWQWPERREAPLPAAELGPHRTPGNCAGRKWAMSVCLPLEVLY